MGKKIDHILLSGGSTRMPMIRQMIRLMSLELSSTLIRHYRGTGGITADLIVNNELASQAPGW